MAPRCSDSPTQTEPELKSTSLARAAVEVAPAVGRMARLGVLKIGAVLSRNGSHKRIGRRVKGDAHPAVVVVIH